MMEKQLKDMNLSEVQDAMAERKLTPEQVEHWFISRLLGVRATEQPAEAVT